MHTVSGTSIHFLPDQSGNSGFQIAHFGDEYHIRSAAARSSRANITLNVAAASRLTTEPMLAMTLAATAAPM
jgi:hypothetical protein